MQRDIASSLAAVGIAAAIVLPSTYAAQSQSYRDDRPALSINQSVDRADARIAALKADLRLTDDQARNWGSLEIALHDIAIKRAKSSVEKSDSQTGRSAAEPPADHPAAGDPDATVRKDRVGDSSPRPDDITAMQREADALAAQSAYLRQISSAAKPLYVALDRNQRQRFVRFVNEDIRMNETRDLRHSYR